MKTQNFCVKKALFCVWLITIQLPGYVDLANILCLMGAPSPSHHIWNRALMEMLANRGHNLTILTVEMEISSKNMHYIFMENIYEQVSAHLSTAEQLDLSRRNPLTMISEMHDFHNFVSRKLIATKGIQELLRYSRKFKFDAIIHDFTLGQVLLGFVPYFQYPPLIAVSPFGIPAHTSVLAGSSLPLSYVPHFTTTFSPPFGLVNRTKNGFYHAFDWFYRRFIFMPNENEYAVELFGAKIPKLERIEQMSTLILVNSDFSIDHVQALPPNVVAVGGLQVKRMDFRDKAVEEFLDKPSRGVVLFSLGSNMRSDVLGADKIAMIMKAFEKLPELNFIWKYKSDIKIDVPKNVLTVDWVSQNDILAHKNLKLFITHGGLLSIQEAYWHAIPILGVPLFMDQHHNIEKAVKDNVADVIDIENLSAEELMKKIKKLITNPRYKEKMKYRSELFKNQPQHPLDRAIFWIEKAIKNNGLQYLRSPTLNMYFYEIHMLDIFFIIFIIAFGYIFIISYHIKAYKKMNKDKNSNNVDNNFAAPASGADENSESIDGKSPQRAAKKNK